MSFFNIRNIAVNALVPLTVLRRGQKTKVHANLTDIFSYQLDFSHVFTTYMEINKSLPL